MSECRWELEVIGLSGILAETLYRRIAFMETLLVRKHCLYGKNDFGTETLLIRKHCLYENNDFGTETLLYRIIACMETMILVPKHCSYRSISCMEPMVLVQKHCSYGSIACMGRMILVQKHCSTVYWIITCMKRMTLVQKHCLYVKTDCCINIHGKIHCCMERSLVGLYCWLYLSFMGWCCVVWQYTCRWLQYLYLQENPFSSIINLCLSDTRLNDITISIM